MSRSASPSRAKPTSAPRADDLRRERRPAPWPRHSTLMFTPSGSLWMTSTLRAGRGEDLRADDAARAVRAVEDDPEPVASIVRREPEAVRPVALEQAAAVDGSGRARRCRRRPSSSVRQMSCSSSSSIVVVELEAALVEDLEPVVVGRVVGGRDHDPGREVAAGRRGTRAPGSGTTPASWTSTPDARRAGRDRRDEHVARAPGVLADDERAARADEVVGGGPAEGVGEGRLEVDVGDAADPVRAEESGHRQGAGDAGDGDGDGDGVGGSGTVIVTVTLGGFTAMSVIPAGSVVLRLSSMGPGAEAVDVGRDHESIALRGRSRSAAGPPRVTSTWSVERL